MTLATQAALGADPMPISGQALVTIVIVLTVLAGLAWGLRRGASVRRSRLPVSVETAVPLGERRSLVIVAVEGRRLLLGMTPGQITFVTELQATFNETLNARIGDPATGNRQPLDFARDKPAADNRSDEATS